MVKDDLKLVRCSNCGKQFRVFEVQKPPYVCAECPLPSERTKPKPKKKQI